MRVVGSDNEEQKRNPEMPSISTSSFCGTISDDSTNLLKFFPGTNKARGYIILSVDDNFLNFPRDVSYCSDDDYEDHATSFDNYSQPETTLFSPKEGIQ